ncbi:Hpt domain-containing protein [Elioraea thermophila]|uniref:Hpt domain-containing protein n=1 Tax=Elioraea thermophila TaxID=2185104 RepID=UPI001300AC44|nr:Hpt domain-containing protein [Elioraea thermophila]
MPRDTSPNEAAETPRLSGLTESMGEEGTDALLVMFRNELHRRLAAITRASATGAYQDLASEAHALAGDARAIGLDSLAERALSAEQAVKTEDARIVAAATGALAEAVHEALLALRRRI